MDTSATDASFKINNALVQAIGALHALKREGDGIEWIIRDLERARQLMKQITCLPVPGDG